MKSICVFCGSSFGSDSKFKEEAETLGDRIAKSGRTLVYGGAKVGLMGVVANAVLKGGGKVIGVLPHFLSAKEIAHKGLTELIFCESMHERKTKMFELSEGFIALPGGFGTLEEISEILTWQQLGLHTYPVAFLNTNGYYNDIFNQFRKMQTSGLLKPENRQMALFADDIDSLLAAMESYKAPSVAKWITKEET